MKAFQDLRFSIGLFFVLVGGLLLLAGFLDLQDRASLNFWTGAGLSFFGSLGIAIARSDKVNP
jgi:hypothetical protein